MTRRNVRLLATLTLIVATALAVVHVLAIAGRPPVTLLGVVATFPVLCIAAIAYIVGVRRWGATMPSSPLWMRAIWTIAAIYGAVNFAVGDRELGDGRVSEIDGRPALVQQGRRPRFLTVAEIQARDAEDVRTFWDTSWCFSCFQDLGCSP